MEETRTYLLKLYDDDLASFTLVRDASGAVRCASAECDESKRGLLPFRVTGDGGVRAVDRSAHFRRTGRSPPVSCASTAYGSTTRCRCSTRATAFRSTMRIGSFPTGRRRCSREEPVRESVRRARRHGGVLGRDRHVEGAGGTVGRADHGSGQFESLARRRRRALSVQGRRSQLQRARAPCPSTMRRNWPKPWAFPMHPTIWRDGMASCAAPAPCSRVATPASRRSPACSARCRSTRWRRSTSNRGRRRSSVSRK